MAALDLDPSKLEAAVREALSELLGSAAPPAGSTPPSPAPALPAAPPVREADSASDKPRDKAAQGRDEALPPPFEGQLRASRPARVLDAVAAERIRKATPARLVQGRAGTRYTTAAYIGLRAEHAIALDAVHGEVDDAFVARLGCLPLRSRAKDREEFLLYPDSGRRLADESRARLEREGTRGADVQVILSDGLAAWALQQSGTELLAALNRELNAQGFKLGRPIFVRYARIGVQDEIGVLLGSRSTLIFVGERPGLGTGDSGSIYTAYAPRLGQDNAEKDCISNIRALGIPPDEAAREAALLLKRSFAAGGGGTHLVRSGQ